VAKNIPDLNKDHQSDWLQQRRGDGHLPTIEKAACKPHSLPHRGVSHLKKVKTEYQLTNRRYLHDKRILQSVKKKKKRQV